MKVKILNIKTCLLLAVLGLFSTMALAIDTPTDPRGAEVGQSLVKWEWNRVSGAANYEVVVDGVNKGLTRDPQLFSRNLWAGEHSMTVRAISWDGSYSSRTATLKINVNAKYNAASPARAYLVGGRSSGNSVASASTGSSSGSISTPQNPRGHETGGGSVQWEWNAVSDAANYEVTVDGAYAGTTSDTKFSSSGLWVGDHSMTVKAVSNTGQISAQSDTVKLYVTGNGSAPASNSNENVVAVAPPPTSGSDNSDAASVKSFIDPASWGYDEVYQKDGYELVFSDEFNGNALNPYRWHTQLRWDGEFNGERFEYRVINGEDQLYVNIFSDDPEHLNKVVPQYNPFQFDGSRLAIRAAKNPMKTNNGDRSYGSLSEIASQQTFLSGAISTHGKFSQKYGYFEARIKIPSHVGTFPAFWLFHESRAWEGTQRTEIDIMENLGHAPWYIYNSFHYFKNVTATYSGDANFLKPRPSGQIYTGTDYSKDYHVYAVEWSPSRVNWYIDGQQVSSLDSSEVNYEDLYVKLNLAMGGNWTNFPTNSGGLGRSPDQHYPNQNDLNNFNNPALEIDYVRVYRRK